MVMIAIGAYNFYAAHVLELADQLNTVDDMSEFC